MKTKENGKLKKGDEAFNYLPNNNVMSGIFDLPGVGGFSGVGPYGQGGPFARITPLSEPWEMIYNNSYMLLSMLRVQLTYAYVIHGPIRTLVDLPVYDAFRGGIKIKSDEVSAEDLEDLHRLMKKTQLKRKMINAMRWERLYGGAAIIFNTNQNFSKPLDINTINEDSLINFIVADRWQIQWTGIPNFSNFVYNPGGNSDESNIVTANIHPSRVAKIVGEEAPGLIKQRLRGWGMSTIECVIREVNLYFKENNVLFELIDEAKVDVWKIDGFNASVLSSVAQGKTSKRIQIATLMKNFLNAITLDAKDDYQQKQVTFSGLAEIMKQIQIGVAAACRMPVSKIFGLSATGFSSGEDDLEVYNAIVENEREKAEESLQLLMPILMMKSWGYVPDDWSVDWKPLRILTAEQEQDIRNSKYTIASGLYAAGILNPQEYCEKLKEDDILTMETEVSKGGEPEPPITQTATDGMMLEEAKGTAKPSQGKKAKE